MAILHCRLRQRPLGRRDGYRSVAGSRLSEERDEQPCSTLLGLTQAPGPNCVLGTC